jgi:Ca2+-transporting ATPase
MDPPRSDVSEAIATVQSAGIRVAMITGDHPETARAIANELGLDLNRGRPLTGAEIDAFDDEEFSRAVQETNVFARVTPEHKLRIVAALQRAGERVAMTGDGVNDAPAVRLADVGISMGRRGAEVTRQAAALVITDDRFPTLLRALAEGRAIQRNLRRGLGFLLGGNMGEALFVGAAVAAGLPMPLLTGQILLLNLLSDALPIIAMVAQPPTAQGMVEPVNREREPVISPDLYREVGLRGVATGAASLAAFYMALRQSGGNLVLARSVGFAAVVGGQLMQIFDEGMLGREAATAGEGRRLLGGALLASALALAASLHLPWMQRMFQFASPGAAGWGMAVAASAAASVALAAGLPPLMRTRALPPATAETVADGAAPADALPHPRAVPAPANGHASDALPSEPAPYASS